MILKCNNCGYEIDTEEKYGRQEHDLTPFRHIFCGGFWVEVKKENPELLKQEEK